jgi:DNA modification methylase
MSLLRADARHIPLSDGCVQCVVTSPPYWGLRDYGTARWDGGDLACDHKQGTARQDGGRVNVNGFNGSAAVDSHKGAMNFKDVCGKCGARRIDQQIGLEQTPDAYVAELMAVFREVRRVLRNDGVVFLNLGDSYYGAGQRGGQFGTKAPQPKWKEKANREGGHKRGTPHPVHGLKFKDMVGIPWRLAFALQQPDLFCAACGGIAHAAEWQCVPPQFVDFEEGISVCPTCGVSIRPDVSSPGWYLRSDIIWHKPNPMPESVTDRPTKAHEYVFLLTKRERYFYDAKAIAEQGSGQKAGNRDYKYAGLVGHETKHGITKVADVEWHQRNARTVWTIATQPYSGAHFATMPEALVERCVLAGSKPGDRVFDPFGGSGTTARVALSLGRKAACTELNPAYLALAQERTHVTLGLPLEVA